MIVVDAKDDRLIVDSCKALFIDYARHVDFGDYDSFVDLFTEDASLDLGFKIQGREHIRRSMSKRSSQLRSRHVLTNLAIDVHSKSLASGIAYLTLYRHIGAESLQGQAVPLRGPAGVGHYSNEFQMTGQGWRISSCKLHFAFQDSTHFPQS